MPSGNQVKNGKSFEYALAIQYVEYLAQLGVRVEIIEDDAYHIAQGFFLEQSNEEQERFCIAAKQTIDTIILLEPGLKASKNQNEVLKVTIASDSEGIAGDVRDVLFTRDDSRWSVGFSAKNNHDAVKHSRLSHNADFGKSWLGVECSQTYWNEVLPIFDRLQTLRASNTKWSDVEDKLEGVYKPILDAFKKELLYINQNNEGIPQKLIQYLIGQYPFYKIIKDDSHNLVVVKAFNLDGNLNKTVNGVKARYKTPRLKLPTRIVEFEYKADSLTTLNMILDEGWEISFRIHSASTKVESSLKFDIQLLGNPPILFTQHLFQN